MYADKITGSMERAIKETERRRTIQDKYNQDNNIIPKTIIKDVRQVLAATKQVEDIEELNDAKENKKLTKKEKEKLIKKCTKEMMDAAKNLQFERAAELRDIIEKLK